MWTGLFYFKSMDWPISNGRNVWLVLLLPWFIEIPAFNGNRVDPDHMPDMGLHCLPVSLLWDTRHKWVNIPSKIR